MTVRENLGFALRIRKWTTAQVGPRVNELAAVLGISHLLDRYPHGLSGGEAQRVALGRALAARPQVLCLDEPMNALDEATHADLCALLQMLKAQTGVTAIHVTHNPHEMRQVADICLRLEADRFEQNTPTAIRLLRDREQING